MGRKLTSLFAGMLALFMLCSLVVLETPARALARSYEISSVDIDATIEEDGSLLVTETRYFDFDGSFGGVFWNIPQGEYEGRNLNVSLLSAGVLEEDEFVPFVEDGSGEDGSYEVADLDSMLELKIYRSSEDEVVAFQMTYLVENALSKSDDEAILYWKFVSDGWDAESQNVHLRLRLPVPAGEQVVAGENVRAWGHGPLDANVYFDGDDVVCDVPSVGTSEFAEIRLTMPAQWAPDVEINSNQDLSSILEEEEIWVEEANERREQAQRHLHYFSIVALGAPFAAIAATISLFVRARVDQRPQFKDEYYRDLPTDDHPAVLGTLYNGGTPSQNELTATLMKLSDDHVFSLAPVQVEKTGFFGKKRTEDDYRLCIEKDRPSDNDSTFTKLEEQGLSIDKRAYDFVEYVTRKSSHAGESGRCCFFSDFSEVAEKHTDEFENHFTSWQSACESAYKNRFLKSKNRGEKNKYFIPVFILEIVLALIIFIIGFIFDFIVPAVLAFIVLVTCFVLGMIAVFQEPLNEEGIEVKAKLKALKHWLKDFTRLDEAIPTDLTLWNRLLVIAVSLGVADEVIKQLQVAMPQIFETDEVNPTYMWYHTHGDSSEMPINRFTSAATYALSESDISSSDWSSSGGGGGGFSGGGGGGFGGGGGGGAF